MPPSRSLQQALDELRRCARTARRRPQVAAQALPLMARLLASGSLEAAEERVGGLVFRVRIGDAGADTLLTCHLRDATRAPPLTASERAVAEQLCEGRTLAQVARLRGVTINTVKSQVRQIFRKLDVGSRVELVRRLVP